MGYTFAEKIISKKSGRQVSAGELAIVKVDIAMATDTTAPLTIKAFKEMGGIQVKHPAKTVFVIDHATPTPNEKISNLQQLMRKFAIEQNLVLYDQGDGICHQLLIEHGHVQSGDLVLGADSHTCTYGAIGALSTGVGSTDLGAVLLTGKSWLRVPESIKVVMTGKLGKYVTAKDVVLAMAGKLTADGATYASLEFCGPGADTLSIDDRMTIANMAIEMGAKNGVFTAQIHDESLQPDPDATYINEYHFNLAEVEPMLACPHQVDNVATVQAKVGTIINQAFLGSCTNGRLSDLAIAAEILKGKRVAEGIRLIVAPASRKILLEAMAQNYIQQLVAAGATILPPGCGPCVGTLGGIPADGDVVISTTNRNFKGRMGNNKAFVYLASPVTVAVSALLGKIANPEEVI